ncbi:MAG: DNA mismatch repair protein MutL, partial [Chloroflexota bacterium]
KMEVRGLIGPASLTWSNRSQLSFFVNRRWVQNHRLGWIVEQAYGNTLSQGQHPLAILHLSLPADEVDVNVHPTKAEVRFRAEFQVQKVISQAVSQTLGHFLPAPSTAEPMALPTTVPLLRVIGQVANCYIIAEGEDGLYLVDQHAAHERVLYQKIISQWQAREVEVQGLLDPIILEVNPKEDAAIKSRLEDLASYGFALEGFGPHSYRVRHIPALLQGKDIRAALQEIVASLAAGVSPGGWQEEIAISLACHGGIKAGQQLSVEEMKELLRQLEQTPSPRTCPHGRPTTLHLSSSLLEREFGRR